MSTIQTQREVRARARDADRPFASLAELLAYHAGRTPDRPAILAPGRPPLSYGALWRDTMQTLHSLRSAGLRRSDRVAIVLPDGCDAAAAILSVTAASVCVPLNPGFTGDEFDRYFTQTGVAALLTSPDLDSPSRRIAKARGIPVLDLSTLTHRASGTNEQPANLPDFAVASDDAFILLSSGTTSLPKTIPLTQSAVCRSAHNVGEAIELTADDRLLGVLPLFHGHGLISGLIAALSVGSSVICTPGFDPATFFRWLSEFRPTWYTAVPTIHRAVLEAASAHKQQARRSSLRLIRSASSTLPTKVLRGLQKQFGVPVIDTLGMTEAATQVAANPLRRRKLGSVGVAAGAEIAILDTAGRQLAPGERGEIALRGPTITRGYDNDPVATRQSFRNGWFRTGDLGYLDNDGYLFLVGRVKEVINRGGQKVAPGEVEEALLRHVDVAEAAAFAVPHGRLGFDVGAAVVLRANAKANARSLRTFVGKHLAAFKVPGLIRIVPDIPRGGGGKIRRAQLAATFARSEPPLPRRGRAQAAGPSNPAREIAALWADLLDYRHIATEQDVFALGIDSITVTQMVGRLRERFGVDLSFKDILEAPTAAALAAHLEKLQHNGRPISPARFAAGEDHARKVKTLQPVAIVQERMLRIEREIPGLPQFNLPFAYRLRGPLDVMALKRSLAELLRRHDSLRTGFAWRNKQPVAFIREPSEVKLSFVAEDVADVARTARSSLKNSSAENQMKMLLRRKARLAAEQESLKTFDMSRPPLFRARLLRLSPDDHVLLLVIHDIVIDGWSMGLFMQDLAALYGALLRGKRAHLPEPALRFSDFVHWQRRWSQSQAAERQFDFWRERLSNVVPLFDAKLETDDRLGAPQSHERLRLPKAILAQLGELSHSRAATLFVTLLAGFKALLFLRTGRGDICVATAMANRSYPGAENVIGPFATTAIVRTRIDQDITFHETIDRVRESVLQAYAHQELPFDVLADRLAEEFGIDPETFIQVYFVLQIAFRRPIKLPGLTVRPFGHREGQSAMPLTRTWLTMTLNETPSGIAGACSYDGELLSRRPWVADYNRVLAKAAAKPHKPIGLLADDLEFRRSD